MPDLPRQGNRLSDHVIGRHEMVAQPDILERLKDLDHSVVVFVFQRYQRKEKSSVEEGHSLGRPYKYWS